jgi:hypothetical protein
VLNNKFVPQRTFSFSVAMKYLLLMLLVSVGYITAFAQEKKVDGIVVDKYTNERIAIVNIRNVTAGHDIYDNLKGEYNIAASIGDILIFSKDGYYPDTLKVENYNSQAVYLKRTGIQLSEVTIRDTVLNPQARLAATKRDYNKVYGSLADKDLLSLSPGAGVGLSIDALYNSISRSGRNAERLRNEIQSDYYQNVIDYRYNRTFVGKITGLKDEQLTEFMRRYRPGYWFVTNASEYDFITYIKANYKRYLRRPKTYALPPLQPAK